MSSDFARFSSTAPPPSTSNLLSYRHPQYLDRPMPLNSSSPPSHVPMITMNDSAFSNMLSSHKDQIDSTNGTFATTIERLSDNMNAASDKFVAALTVHTETTERILKTNQDSNERMLKMNQEFLKEMLLNNRR